MPNRLARDKSRGQLNVPFVGGEGHLKYNFRFVGQKWSKINQDQMHLSGLRPGDVSRDEQYVSSDTSGQDVECAKHYTLFRHPQYTSHHHLPTCNQRTEVAAPG